MRKPNRPIPELTPQDISRFWSKIEGCGSNGCWEWIGTKLSNGYGVFSIMGTHYNATRVLWFVITGKDPGSFMVCHRCDNRGCCRFSHIFLGSHEDNMRDMVQKGRSASGDRHASRLYPEKRPRGENHYLYKHPELAMGERNNSARLNEPQVKEIRKIYAAGGIGLQRLGKKFGVSKRAILFIVQRKHWKHI